jgi:hypothetical protein
LSTPAASRARAIADARAVAGVGIAAALAAAYLIGRPSTLDLAAQAFRADLFASHGFLIWNDYWYGGHYLLGYSVLFPPLAALLGVRVTGALAAIATAALFTAIVQRPYGGRAWIASLWLGGATAAFLVANRLTFALGTAIGLGALLAVQRGRPLLASGLAALAALASPVAGIFVAVAGGALAVTGQRRIGVVLVVAALAPIAILAAAFPTGGYFPFATGAFIPVPLFAVAALLLVPAEERVLRAGVVIYAVVCIILFAFHTPIGANAARLGSLFGGPVLALGLTGRRPVALAVCALPLLYWQWSAPVRDLAAGWDDPSTTVGYYRPLIDELHSLTAGRPARIEIPPTRNRFEAEYVAPTFPLARGWLRQSESGDFDLFVGGDLTPAAYRAWLFDNGVSYVALADADPDYLAEDEDELIRDGLPYLRPVWSNDHWRLYRVERAIGLTSPAAHPAESSGPANRLTRVGAASFAFAAQAAGSYLVRIHYTPYWAVTSGDACVAPDGDWTRLDVRHPGTVEVAARFSVGGLARRDSECSG